MTPPGNTRSQTIHRLLVGLLWGKDGLDRGYSLSPKMPACGWPILVSVGSVIAAQLALLPRHNPWPVKLIGALNFVAVVGIYVCERRKAWSALRAVVIGAAAYTAIICGVVWFGGFVPRLTQSEATALATDAVAASSINIATLQEPSSRLVGEGGSDPFVWVVDFDNAGGRWLARVEVQDSNGETRLTKFARAE